ncbi:hypothetical protein, partial [Burkholderia thailandensis]|uniref:hypothetical protein n=1 Tax=Burkholderia thailandensis TaxID=57975 RepID=UPI0021C8C797
MDCGKALVRAAIFIGRRGAHRCIGASAGSGSGVGPTRLAGTRLGRLRLAVRPFVAACRKRRLVPASVGFAPPIARDETGDASRG